MEENTVSRMIWCESEEKAMEIIKAEEKEKNLSFKGKKLKDFDVNSSVVRWNERLPYIILQSKTLHSFSNENAILNQSTVDGRGSAVSAVLFTVATFPKYRVRKNSNYHQKKASQKLKASLRSGEETKKEIRFYVKFTPTPATTLLSKQQNWASSYMAALKHVEEFQIKTRTKFVHLRKYKCNVKGRKLSIKWDDASLTPYVVIQTILRECHLGKSRKKTNTKLLDHQRKRQRLCIQNSKKIGCPATLSILECVKFPRHKVAALEPLAMLKAESMIRRDIARDQGSLLKDTYWLIKFPSENHHHGHNLGEYADVSWKSLPTLSRDSPSTTIDNGVTCIPISLNAPSAADTATIHSRVNSSNETWLDEAQSENNAALPSSSDQTDMREMIAYLGSLTTEIYSLLFDLQTMDDLQSVASDFEMIREKVTELCSHDSGLRIAQNPAKNSMSLKRKSSSLVCDELPRKQSNPYVIFE